MLPVVAIVGRPNVGKSTLFNRLVGKRKAIESKVPGTTRDRVYVDTVFREMPVMLVDTGGISTDETDDIEENVQEQAKVAIEEADLVVFVVDAQQELTTLDFAAADLLRKSRKPTLLVANKCDNANLEERAFNVYELGFGEAIKVSAAHTIGVEEVESRAFKELKELGFKPEKKKPEAESKAINLAFLGRVNVGKSSLVNAILAEDKVIVSDQPGTTRDATDTLFKYQKTDFNLIDTAGIRRRGRVEQGIERFSVIRSLEAIERSDVGLLVLDFEEGVTNQDCHVAEFILESTKGLIIVVNKVDLAGSQEQKDRFLRRLQRKLAFLPWAPVIFVSALKRTNVEQILVLAKQIHEAREKQLEPEDLEGWLVKVKHQHNLPTRGKRRLQIFSLEQTETAPPVFRFRVNDISLLHFSYRRYLENNLRKEFGFEGTAIRLVFKAGMGRR